MHAIWQDLRYGLRGLGNRPGFTILAVLTLALGIGAATTIFSVIYNVMLDPFPYLDARRVGAIQIRDATSTRPGGRNFLPGRRVPRIPGTEPRLRGCHRRLDAKTCCMTTAEGTEQLTGGMTTPNTFSFLGVPAVARPDLHRPTTRSPDAPPVFVMAHKMWVKHFNLDPSWSARRSSLNGVPDDARRASCRSGSPSWPRISGGRSC